LKDIRQSICPKERHHWSVRTQTLRFNLALSFSSGLGIVNLQFYKAPEVLVLISFNNPYDSVLQPLIIVMTRENAYSIM
jgi:hypothetical protein